MHSRPQSSPTQLGSRVRDEHAVRVPQDQKPCLGVLLAELIELAHHLRMTSDTERGILQRSVRDDDPAGQFGGEREPIQAPQSVTRQNRPGPLDGPACKGADPFPRQAVEEHQFVVAEDPCGLESIHHRDALSRVRPVPDDVPGTNVGVDLPLPKGPQDCQEGRQIRVHV